MFIVKKSRKITLKTENFEDALDDFLANFKIPATRKDLDEKSLDEIKFTVTRFLELDGRFQWGPASITLRKEVL